MHTGLKNSIKKSVLGLGGLALLMALSGCSALSHSEDIVVRKETLAAATPAPKPANARRNAGALLKNRGAADGAPTRPNAPPPRKKGG